MNKIYSAGRLALRLLFILLCFCGKADAQYSGTGTFTKITSAANLTDGYYVIGYNDAQAMSNSYSGVFLSPTPVTVAGGTTITNPATSIVWKIETNGTGKSIYNEPSAKYVSFTGASGSNNVQVVTAVTANNQRWNITYNGSLFVLTNVAVTAVSLQYNSSAPRFACYGSNQNKLMLYKMAAAAAPALATSATALTGLNYTGFGPSAAQSFTVSGANLTGFPDDINVTAPANYEVSVTSATTGFAASATIAYTTATLTAKNVWVRLKQGLAAGSYNLQNITFSGGEAPNKTVAVSGTVTLGLAQGGFTSVLTPQYMASGDLTRLPVMFRATVTDLSPNTTYRYYIQGTNTFGGTNPGAGNPLMVNNAATTYKYPADDPDLSTAALYETFTTSASGTFTGWFGLVNTSNAVFNAGSNVFPVIVMGTGTTEQYMRAMNVSMKALSFTASAGASNGSFLKSTSQATAKNLAAVYDNTTGSAVARPLFISPIQNITATIDDVVPGFLTTAGSWNAIVPNTNANGVRRIEQLSLSTGALVGCAAIDPDGNWPTGPVNTVNPATGATAIVIAAADAPLMNCPVPEINITGNSVSIADADATPSLADHTDFGSAAVATGSVTRVFTIENTGTAALSLTGLSPYITTGGTNAADFTVTVIPSPSIAAAGSVTFEITFVPSATGLRSATISIANDDANENPYNFSIQGTGTAPEINVQQGATNYLDGTSTYTFANTVTGAFTDAMFTIQNTGNSTLTIAAIDITGAAYSLQGTNPALPISIPAGSNATFTLRFTPSATGAATGAVSITNDDTNENPYTINLGGSGVPASSSNIIRSTAFTEPSDIAYINYQSANIDGTGVNDIKIGEFTIQDGGGLNDADNMATILNSITFNVTGAANIRRLAIYDGATEIGAEQAGAASVTFSGLSLTATDNAEKTFSVYASFNAAVTDNQQIVLTISNAVESTAGSSFATANAGGASTAVTGNSNRIEVIATRLVFGQQPTSGPVLANMSPAVTVSARDEAGFNNIDLDYTTTVTLSITSSTCGSLTGNTATPSGGIASFPSLQGTVAETGLTLTATSGAITSAVSNGFNFTGVAAAAATLVGWNFDDGNAVADFGIAGNTAVTISSNAAGTTTFPQGQLPSPDNCMLSTDWRSGSGSKAWTTGSFKTTGYSNITFSSVHRSSNTGPKDFKVQYSLNGSAWTDVPGATMASLNEGWPTAAPENAFVNFALPAACDNQPAVSLRWLQTSNTSADNGTIGSTGTNGIDEIYVKGTVLSSAANLYYQTSSSGDFKSPCIWQTSTNGLPPWKQAAVPPDFSSQTITILNTHTVTISTAQTLDQLVVNSGGELVLNDVDLTLNNGTGTDLLVNGTFTDNASSANGTTFTTGSTWSLGNNGTFVKTRNSGSTGYQANYEGGIANIQATASWILRYTGASDISFTSTGAWYPNLTFESNSGAWNPAAASSRFTGASNFTRVKGNLDIGGTGTGTVTVYNENTNGTPMLVAGNLIVRDGNTLTNNGAGTGFEIKKDITIDGDLIINANDKGILKLSGTVDQSVDGSATGEINVWELQIANPLKVITHNKDLSIFGTLSFDNNAGFKFGSGDIFLKSTAAHTANVGQISNTVIDYSGAGRFVVERYIATNTHGRAWQFLATPASGNQTIREAWQENNAPGLDANHGFGTLINSSYGTAAGFDGTSAGTYIKQYVSNTDQWDNGPVNTGVSINSPNGYMLFVRGDRSSTQSGPLPSVSTVLRTRGMLYGPGNLPYSVSVLPDKYQSVGNPYASAIDIRQLITTNLTQQFYIWDPSAGGIGFGIYRTITQVGTNYEITPTGGMYPDDVVNEIQSGQAFFVKAQPALTGNIAFSEAAKTTGNSLVTRGGPNEIELLKVNLLSGNAAGTMDVLDGAMAIFGDYSKSLDSDDGIKLMNSNENAGFRVGDKLVSVERRPSPQVFDTLHLQLLNAKPKTYEWQMDLRNMGRPGRLGWLYDKYLQTKTPLDLSGETTISFTVDAIAGSAAIDRFKIIFNDAAAGPLPVTITGISANRENDHSITVRWAVENELNLQYYTIERSANGISFAALLTVNAADLGSYSGSDISPLAGDNYYRIKAVGLNGLVQYSAIVKVAPLQLPSSITIYPNPVEGKRMRVVFTGQPRGDYNIQVINKLGQVIYIENTVVNGNNVVKTIDLGAVSAGSYEVRMMGAAGKIVSQQIIVN